MGRAERRKVKEQFTAGITILGPHNLPSTTCFQATEDPKPAASVERARGK